jgi:hypothetical protein
VVDAVDEVGAVAAVGPVDVVGAVEVVRPGALVEVVAPSRSVVPVDETVVDPVAEVVEVLPVVVVDGLADVGGATGTVAGGSSGCVVPVVLGSPEVVGTVVDDGSVVTDEGLVNPVVVVDGVVVVVVGGIVVTDVTDVTDGSDVALPVGAPGVVVVVAVVPAADAKAGTPMIPPAMSRAKMVPRDRATRLGSPLVEISEEKGISGHPRS